MDWTPESKVLVQGINEPLASHYAAEMKAYGTNVVAGVCAGWGGEHLHEIPVFDLVEQALEEVGEVDVSLIFANPYWALDAALEAIAAGIARIILISSGVPPLDMVRLVKKAQATGTLVLGPGSAGIIVPDTILLGTVSPQYYSAGTVGLISRMNCPTYEVALALTQAGLGQSIAIHLGTGGIAGSNFERWLQILEKDKTTEAIILIGQPGSSNEETAASYIATAINKPVIAYLPGIHAPVGQRLEDATAIVAANLSVPAPDTSTAKQKIAAFEKAKVTVAKRPSQIPNLVTKALKKK